jgi:hypothetical protein
VDDNGHCVGFDQQDKELRSDRVDVDCDDARIIAWIRGQPGVDDGTIRAGVGDLGFQKRIELPAASGTAR